MNKIWSDAAWDDYLYWQGEDRKMLKKINNLIKAVEREPYTGLGKPEPLRYYDGDVWSKTGLQGGCQVVQEGSG